MKKVFILSSAIILITLNLHAAKFVANGSFWTGFGSGGNWTVTGVDGDNIPDADDTCYVNSGDMFILNDTAICYKLVIDGSNGTNAQVLISNGHSLTILGDLIIKGSANTGQLTSSSFSKFSIGGDITLEGTTANKALINLNSPANSFISGNINLNPLGTFQFVDGNVHFDGTGAQSLPGASSSARYGAITINKPSGTITQLSSISTTELQGSFTVSSGTYDDGGFPMASSATFTLSSGTVFNNSAANFPNCASYSVSDATINLTNATSQNFGRSSKTINYGNVNITGGGSVTAVGTMNNINGILTVSNSSSLSAANKVRIISNGSGTAAIGEINGTVSGNVNIQRYVSDMSAAGNPGWWYFLGAPVSGQTVAEINDDITTTGFTNSDFPSATFNSVQKWDFGTGAYVGATGLTDAMPVGEGWFVYMGSNDPTYDIPATIDWTGSIDTGSYSGFNISSTADDYSPLANPYPSDVTFSLATMANSNIADPYVIQPDGSFAALTNGSTLGLAEGFFVRSTGGAATLTFEETDKLGSVEANSVFNKSSNSSAVNSNQPKLQVEITKVNGIVDYSYLQLDDSKTVGMDYPADFSKLENINGFTNIYFETSGRNAHINNIPSNLGGVVSFPIGINRIASFNQNVTLPFTIKGVEDFKKANICVQLENTATGQIMNLDKDFSATIQWNDSAAATPYILHLSNGFDQTSTPASCYGEQDGNIVVTPSASGSYNYYLTSIIGDTLASAMNQTGNSYTFNDLAAGTYQIKVDDMGAACGVLGQKVEINEPEAVISFFTVPTEVVDLANNNNLAFTNVSANSSTYFWDFGDGNTSTQNEPTHYYNTVGNYEVSLTAIQGSCADTSVKSIEVIDTQVGIEEVAAAKEVSLIQRNEQVLVTLHLTKPERVRFNLTNTLGQEVSLGEQAMHPEGTFELTLPEANQVYFLNIQGETFETSYKLMRR